MTIAWREVIERIDWQLIVRTLYETPREHAGPYVFFGGWAADYPDPDSFLRVGLAERWTGRRHEGYARLVEQARRSTDQRARLDLHRQADRIVIEEALIMPLHVSRVGDRVPGATMPPPIPPGNDGMRMIDHPVITDRQLLWVVARR